MHSTRFKTYLTAALIAALALSGCARASKTAASTASAADLDCMTRAMYFESNRSSRDGMIAVGTVVMNRVQSDDFPRASAAAVLAGERHPNVGGARFFHAAWYTANFNNIHYVVTAGGNAFYEKRRPQDVTSPNPLPQTEGITGPGTL